MTAPAVSVIVPAYNAAPYIAATIDSVRRQTFSDFELVIVDDGSTDETAAIVEAIAAEEPRLHFIRQKNTGNPAARNAGFAAARGLFIAPLDADDLWFPDKLEQQMAAFAAGDPALGLVYGWSVYIDTDGKPTGGFLAREENGDAFLTMLCDNFVGSGSVPLMRREVMEAAGGYRGDFPGIEDKDLFMRIAARARVACVREFHIAYRQVPGSQSRKYRAMEQSYRGFLAAAARENPGVPPETLERAMAWSQGVFFAYLATKCLSERKLRPALDCVRKAVTADPAALARIAQSVLARLRRGAPSLEHWRVIETPSGPLARPPLEDLRLTPSPVGGGWDGARRARLLRAAPLKAGAGTPA